ncbi:sorbitol-6-phosphate dehydrogenase subunit [Clostridium estertheticum]|uniref:Sorbitol-6-phosphate 2-dehydrogenase n=1 Tax=Clostridium estertheticum subsp. estertheticum TaxID=1552 RepID=A0A1J0GBX0_9CLOT|nr:sorbitol-6-phosphate dehydrogenase subunit [Clostridium estertheticum]APC38834.1 sorbitol-6-phosphate 2-dehydrogenase [Clostridium estertheticum subsp. estertheticum]MBU3074551.1 SDR family oxidoreductase [Clostridium estertheticum]MBU3164737.1 SDR family oxidoreductase [Clostridium estertheticum]MBU3171283.1 SDR family oxidoreductase [Clostridium estertheticum]MBU3185728.1 SDR family oxidoreductase [Clostridium estertheticum]
MNNKLSESKNWLNIDGKTIIVTGGNSGIGLHIVNELKENGANVVVADMNVETGKKDGVYNIKTNVTSIDSINAMVLETVKEYGKIDVLVNNAGINLPRLLVDVYSDEKKYEINEESFNKMTAVNQKGIVFVTQAVVRDMLARKIQGVIINISSESGMEGSVGQSLYSATKGAVNSYTRSWAKELGKFGIKVVAIAPGINEKTGLTTPAYNEALAYTRNINVDQLDTGYEKSIPLGRVGKLDEIAYLVTFLASGKSGYITGTVINISGGKSRG